MKSKRLSLVIAGIMLGCQIGTGYAVQAFNTYSPIIIATNDVDNEATISIRDNNLEQKILEQVDNNQDGKIQLSEIDSLKNLVADDAGIELIDGIENAINLQSLSLTDNLIENVSYLSTLSQLTKLDLSNNNITDITPLLKLNNLQQLNIEQNLLDLKNETTLNVIETLENNNVQVTYLNQQMMVDEESPILEYDGELEFEVMQYEYFEMPNVVAVDNSGEAEINLLITKDEEEVQSFTTSIFGLYTLTYTAVDKSGNESDPLLISLNVIESEVDEVLIFTDAELEKKILAEVDENRDGKVQRSEIEKLELLSLNDIQVSNLERLENAINLTDLYVGNNNLTDITWLDTLTSLTYLSVYNNEITDISPLSALINLTDLDLGNSNGGNKVEDISPIADLTNLMYLSMDTNLVVDITPLNELLELRGINLRNNQIIDLEPLSGLENLLFLNVSNNEISDVSALDGLGLMELDLSGNNITDISALASLEFLWELNLENNFLNLEDEETMNVINYFIASGADVSYEQQKEQFDDEIPILNYDGEIQIVVVQGDKNFEMPVVTVSDNIDTNPTLSLKITKNGQEVDEVDVNQLGTTVLSYTAVDFAGNQSRPLTLNVNVVLGNDTESLAKAISYAESQMLNIQQSSNGHNVFRSEEWVTSVEYNRLAVTITASKRTLEDFEITQNELDKQLETLNIAVANFNDAKQYGLKRDIEPEAVEDTEIPVINYTGKLDFEIYQGQSFTVPRLTATDNIDENMTVSLEIRRNGLKVDIFDSELSGTYKLTYSAEDSAGNQAEDVIILVKVNKVDENTVIPEVEEIEEEIIPEVEEVEEEIIPEVEEVEEVHVCLYVKAHFIAFICFGAFPVFYEED
ncbi:MAG: hypothetical protein ATN36_07040 [Epulopiscium sp. Nele67-Bin005]|nr:MAG: hypothetical protein ATN36_07040 [Epulopiscium sp. Nele67-Bin005]